MTSRLGRLILIVVLISILLGSGLSCSSKSYSGPADSMTFGAQLLEGAIPIFVAQEQGFFTQNGINLTLKGYDTGAQALNGMLKNEVDLAIVSDYLLANQALNQAAIQTIGSTGGVDYVSIVGRKDHGVTTVSQLAGRRIGIIKGTALDFFLGHFLTLHALDPNSVTLVNEPSLSQMTDSLVQGDVDAIISQPPYTDDAQSKLGDNAVYWPAQGGQMIFVLLVGQDQWLSWHPALAQRFLKAIGQAEQFIAQHPQEAKTIAKKKMNLNDEGVSAVWARNHFRLSLDQSLILALEDESRWLINKNLSPEKQAPNFLSYVSADALKAVNPEAVKIVGK